MLIIKNLSVAHQGKPILNQLNLQIKTGEVAAIMGPNGSGKSTLAHSLAGHPDYQVTSGTAQLGKTNLLTLKPEERAQAGLFLAFQHPPALPGISVAHFLQAALNAQEKAAKQPTTNLPDFLNRLKPYMQQLALPWEFAQRDLNTGFSGGEKKRLELLQILVLTPKLVILDEIDSGLDIDALKLVAQTVRKLVPKTTLLVITHYQRILSFLKPDSVHVLKNGQISQSGGPELALELEKHGYQPT